MPNRDSPASYHAYLLRCWREPGHDGSGLAGWRFSVESPSTGARQGFPSWGELVDFLRSELCGTPDDDGVASLRTETEQNTPNR